jgi:hypothetical protein
MFLDIPHRPVGIENTIFSDTAFCLRLQVESSKLGPIDRVSPYLRTPAPTHQQKVHLKMATKTSIRNIVFKIKSGQWICPEHNSSIHVVK